MTRIKITQETLLNDNFQEIPLIDECFMYSTTFSTNTYTLVEIRSYSPEYYTYIYINGDKICRINYMDEVENIKKIMCSK